MKNILLIGLLITGVAYADDCSDNKRKAAKYEQMSMSASNMDIAAKYIKMSMDYKKKSMDTCFMSGGDKEKMRTEIKDMEEMRKDLKKEAYKNRQHEKDLAKENSDITVRYR